MTNDKIYILNTIRRKMKTIKCIRIHTCKRTVWNTNTSTSTSTNWMTQRMWKTRALNGYARRWSVMSKWSGVRFVQSLFGLRTWNGPENEQKPETKCIEFQQDRYFYIYSLFSDPVSFHVYLTTTTTTPFSDIYDICVAYVMGTTSTYVCIYNDNMNLPFK